MASSCPTMIRRKLASRTSASRPVRVGSKGTLTRDIVFWAPFTTTPDFPRANCMPYFGAIVKSLLTRLRGSHFDPAHQSSIRHSQQHEYNLSNILWRYLPISSCRSAAESCIDASGHYMSHSHVVVPMIQQHCFRQSGQSEFRSIVSCAACKCIPSSQATHIDDVAAATILEARQRCARAIKRSGEVRLQRLLPLLHRQLRGAGEQPNPGIVYQNVGATRFAVNPSK